MALSQMPVWTTQQLYVNLDAYVDRPLLAYFSQFELWITRHSADMHMIIMNERIYGGESVGYAPFMMRLSADLQLYHGVDDESPLYSFFTEAGLVGPLRPHRVKDLLSFIT